VAEILAAVGLIVPAPPRKINEFADWGDRAGRAALTNTNAVTVKS
jgi:hypothetical protein